MTWTIYLAFTVVGMLFLWYRKPRYTPPYPPGPPADPIIGHLRVLPQSNPEVVFREMSKKYGDIIYFHIPGKSILVLNSLKVATELLDQRGGIYSDRAWLPLYDLMGWSRDTALTLIPYGKRFLKHRRLFNEYLNEKKCISYWPLQTRCAHRLLMRLLDNSQNWMKHVERFSAEIIVKITYGKDIMDNDPYMDISDNAIASALSCGSPGSTIVDLMPFLTYMPSWFPGTHYAYVARSFFPAVQEMYRYPFEGVKRQMREGTARPSYITHHLEQLHDKEVDEEHVKDLQGSAVQMYVAGAETTSAAILFFILDMVLFPEVQKQAQDEIDSWLPEISDRGSLPYVQAVISEVLRWNPVLPSGIPHCSTEDDIYDGMYIPKGTLVIPNAYAILRDETIYTNPDAFNPNRYLPMPEGHAEPHPTAHYGFGRRICVGKHLADASIFIAVVSILSTLDIIRAKDDDGNDIIPELRLESGLTSHPKPFPCIIRPRDKASEALIRQAQFCMDEC